MLADEEPFGAAGVEKGLLVVAGLPAGFDAVGVGLAAGVGCGDPLELGSVLAGADAPGEPLADGPLDAEIVATGLEDGLGATGLAAGPLASGFGVGAGVGTGRT